MLPFSSRRPVHGYAAGARLDYDVDAAGSGPPAVVRSGDKKIEIAFDPDPKPPAFPACEGTRAGSFVCEGSRCRSPNRGPPSRLPETLTLTSSDPEWITMTLMPNESIGPSSSDPDAPAEAAARTRTAAISTFPFIESSAPSPRGTPQPARRATLFALSRPQDVSLRAR